MHASTVMRLSTNPKCQSRVETERRKTNEESNGRVEGNKSANIKHDKFTMVHSFMMAYVTSPKQKKIT